MLSYMSRACCQANHVTRTWFTWPNSKSAVCGPTRPPSPPVPGAGGSGVLTTPRMVSHKLGLLTAPGPAGRGPPDPRRITPGDGPWELS